MSYDFIKESVKVCMFDQYGTVVDMQGGLTAIATPFLKAKGWSGDPNSFVTWWRRTHFENSMIDALLHREHTPYREIGHRAVAHVMDRAGIEHSRQDVRYLVGEVTSVMGLTRTFVEDREGGHVDVDDAVEAVVEFETRAVGTKTQR